MKGGKLLIFSAPSGSGKTTIVRYLLDQPELNLAFSVSATSRPRRKDEEEGKNYYFMTSEEFKLIFLTINSVRNVLFISRSCCSLVVYNTKG